MKNIYNSINKIPAFARMTMRIIMKNNTSKKTVILACPESHRSSHKIPASAGMTVKTRMTARKMSTTIAFSIVFAVCSIFTLQSPLAHADASNYLHIDDTHLSITDINLATVEIPLRITTNKHVRHFQASFSYDGAYFSNPTIEINTSHNWLFVRKINESGTTFEIEGTAGPNITENEALNGSNVEIAKIEFQINAAPTNGTTINIESISIINGSDTDNGVSDPLIVFDTFEDTNDGNITYNTAPTDISLDGSYIDNIDENMSIDTEIGTFTTDDSDTGDTHTYDLVPETNDFFYIAGDKLYSKIGFDFEDVNSYTIEVLSTDGSNESIQQTFTIEINDVNETPSFDATTYDFTIDENSSAPVGSTSATDPDTTSPNNDLSFSINESTESDVFNANNDIFAIDSSGDITVVDPSALDYEDTTNFSYTIKVTDGDGETHTATLNITLEDLNEAPTLANDSFNIDENTTNGTEIRTIIGIDLDTTAPNNTLTYSITSGNDLNAFAIDTNSGVITINDESLIDHELHTDFMLEVTVSDGEYPVSAEVEIIIDDVNEKPIFDHESYLFYEENTATIGKEINPDGLDVTDPEN